MSAAGHYSLDSSPPSAFIERWLRERAPGPTRPQRALDVAMGTGRHARLLLQHGYTTFGVDRHLDALLAARRASGPALRAWCADLTAAVLPTGHFDLIVVCRYLQRDLFPALAAALTPGGMLLYETFTEAQRAHGWGPRSAEHLLQPGELLARTTMLETIAYEEVEAPEAVARLAARRSSSRV